MTNPKVICFLCAFLVGMSYCIYYVYANRNAIYEHFLDWACYCLCADMHTRGVPIEPATNWIHRRAIKYAIKHNKDAIFITVD